MAVPESIKRAQAALEAAMAYADGNARAMLETHGDECDHSERHWVSMHLHQITTLLEAAEAHIVAVNRHLHP